MTDPGPTTDVVATFFGPRMLEALGEKVDELHDIVDRVDDLLASIELGPMPSDARAKILAAREILAEAIPPEDEEEN